MALVLLMACSITDYVRVLAHTTTSPPPSSMRQIVDRLTERPVRVAFADYWRAYIITFLRYQEVEEL